jgi:O-6-methylguanine DNA methyltransferase
MISGDFSARVLQIVQRIPRGQTLTYQKVAQLAGSPKAFRAVGNILNKNTRPDLIPCHRVIRSDGKIGGYRWGGAKKQKILREEGAI